MYVIRSECNGVSALIEADLGDPLHVEIMKTDTYLIMPIACVIAGAIIPVVRTETHAWKVDLRKIKKAIWLFSPWELDSRNSQIVCMLMIWCYLSVRRKLFLWPRTGCIIFFPPFFFAVLGARPKSALEFRIIVIIFAVFVCYPRWTFASLPFRSC